MYFPFRKTSVTLKILCPGLIFKFVCFFVFFGSKQAEDILTDYIKTLQATDWSEKSVTNTVTNSHILYQETRMVFPQYPAYTHVYNY